MKVDYLKTTLKIRKKLCYTLVLLGALYTSGQGYSVFAQEAVNRNTIALQNQIAALKSQLTQLEQSQSTANDSRYTSSNGGQLSSSGLLPDLLNRVNNLEDQQRLMRGQLDDLTNQFQSKIDELSKKIEDKNFASGVNEGSPPQVSQSDNVTKPTAKNSTQQEGQQALLNGNYAQAESIARSLLASDQGARSVNAHFLLAQALAGQKKYKEASVGYFDIFRKFPNSARAPEALLGVSITMIKNNKNKEACQALALLKGKYPAASPRIKSAASILHNKAHCS